ncbi:MAG: T9SS type A sorting domain-containing protein [Bacteroidota bacterium]
MKRIIYFSMLSFALSHAVFSQTERQGNKLSQREVPLQKVKVFPNPATNVVNILGLINTSARAEILITDMYGNEVLRHRWEIRDNALSIPIASLQPGIYAISIISKEQKVRTKFYKK